MQSKICHKVYRTQTFWCNIKKYWKCQNCVRAEVEYYFLDNKNYFKLKVSDHRKCPMAYGDSENTVVNIYLMSINTS